MLKNVHDVITEYMVENGYNALYNDGCGCSIDDLAPCYQSCIVCDFGVMIDCEHCENIDTCGDSSIEMGYDACEIAVPVGWCAKAIKTIRENGVNDD